MKIYLIVLIIALVSACSTIKHNSNNLDLSHKILNDVYGNKSAYRIYYNSSMPYSKDFILKDLVEYFPSFYNASRYEVFNRKKDSILNLNSISEIEKEKILKETKDIVFFETGEFFSDSDIVEFAKSWENLKIKWDRKRLSKNIVLSKNKNTCAISLPIFNNARDKAIVFKRCSSSENFDAFELTSDGKWNFAFTANIILYD